ncbi:MAG: 50S ribosomal protein L18 [Coriobacteriales bacterium]|jgi:large subunit ribosomal protein L18|nr:50S ribosomal protein L18 [Coriobacteriales bacterium]
MEKNKAKAFKLARRKTRVRAKVSGSATCPRLCVTRSNANIYAQVIDDDCAKTLVSASTIDKELRRDIKQAGNVEGAKAVGAAIAKRAQAAGISQVVFDRGGHIYHGRVQALAEAARENGLKF